MTRTGSKRNERTDEELLAAIAGSEADDDLAEIAQKSPAELSASIRAQGGDPEAIGARGAKLAEELLARRKRLRWQAKAHGDLGRALGRIAEAPRTPALPREELLARIEAARADARLREPIAAAFRKRTAEESSDLELRGLLDEIEMLRKLEES